MWLRALRLNHLGQNKSATKNHSNWPYWLNHDKEHFLVGIKDNPTEMNRALDCDIIVAEVRATSHKPVEIYGSIECLSPGTRRIELFGRAHNVQPKWITLGTQLDGVRLV